MVSFHSEIVESVIVPIIWVKGEVGGNIDETVLITV